MGLFDLFDRSSPTSRPLLTYLPILSFAFSTAAQHDISFDLTTPCTSAILKRPRPAPNPVPIPLEVVIAIMEAAYYNDLLEPDETFLKHCALVCREWSAPAQKLLFSRVTLLTQPACDSFQQAIDRTSERGRMLGDAVLRMRVVLDHNQPFGVSQHSFGRAVGLCPNLYELNLSLYGCAAPGEDIVGAPDVLRMRRPAPSFDEQTLALLKSGPKITALQFNNWSENHHSIMQLLHIWPTLKSLAISGTSPEILSPSSEPVACSLEELRMNFQIPPSVDSMKWLLHNSVDTLRVLEFEREPPIHMLDSLLDAHGSTLHSLSLPDCSSHQHALAVQKCQELKEFRMESPSPSQKLYRQLPGSLEHVAFGLDRNTTLQPVLELIKSNDTIKVVTVHVWNGGDRHHQLSSLKIACVYRGIDLRVTNDIRMFRVMTRGDPVTPQSYPRIKSLDNLHVMRS